MKRQDFEMTDEDLTTLMAACKPVALVATHCGHIKSPQENANTAWSSLGKKLGFDYMTVQPSAKGDKFFTAEAVADA